MSTATVTRDYKITLPKEIRESMHLQPGQEFELIQNGSGIQIVPTANRLSVTLPMPPRKKGGIISAHNSDC